MHIVLDVSGSMGGQAIDDAKRAAEAAVEKLESNDDFSMVTFSDTATSSSPTVPSARVATRYSRASTTCRRAAAPTSRPVSTSGTPRRARRASGDEAVRLVMLLSDGHANGGDTSVEHLADRAGRAFQDGVETSAFGLGPDFDAALMSEHRRSRRGWLLLHRRLVADRARPRPRDRRAPAARGDRRRGPRPPSPRRRGHARLRLARALRHEADAVRAQEVAVDLHEKQRGIASDRQVDAAGGMRFFIPAFARADRHATLITLQLPPGAGERRIASVEVRYKDRLLKKNVTQRAPCEPALGGERRGERAHRRPRRRASRAGLRRR